MNYVVKVLYGTESPWQPSDYIKSDSRAKCDIKTTVIS